MEIKDALDIMNSDFKLWEKADSEDLGDGKVSKTLTLPWGIGEYTVTLEGMNDSNKRRAAVGAYGEHIRSLIDERINDEAVTSRAKAAAGRAEQANSEDSDGVSRGVELPSGTGEEEVQEATYEEAEEVYEEPPQTAPDLRETLIARRASLNGRIERLTAELDIACRDLRGIDAALEAMDND